MLIIIINQNCAHNITGTITVMPKMSRISCWCAPQTRGLAWLRMTMHNGLGPGCVEATLSAVKMLLNSISVFWPPGLRSALGVQLRHRSLFSGKSPESEKFSIAIEFSWVNAINDWIVSHHRSKAEKALIKSSIKFVFHLSNSLVVIYFFAE